MPSFAKLGMSEEKLLLFFQFPILELFIKIIIPFTERPERIFRVKRTLVIALTALFAAAAIHLTGALLGAYKKLIALHIGTVDIGIGRLAGNLAFGYWLHILFIDGNHQ